MKKLLGSLFLLLFETLSGSSLYEYDISLSNQNPYVKESVNLTITLKQKDKSKVMFFLLTPIKNSNFKLHLLGTNTINKTYHDNTTTYRYILYPLSDGEHSLDFNLTITQSTDKGVEKFYTGNRDVIKPMSAKYTKLQLKPIKLIIKKLSQNVDMIGEFKLDFSHDNTYINSYEQLNATYILEGKGYINNNLQPLPPIKNVETFFLSTSSSKSVFLKKSKLIHKYAFISDKNFTIPSVDIKCFSPKQEKFYTLSSPKVFITVRSKDEAELVDTVDNYPTKIDIFEKLSRYIEPIIFLFIGFIIGKISFKNLFKIKPKKVNFPHDKIKKSNTHRELLQLLLTIDDTKYKPYIQKLNSSIYKSKTVSLKEIKDELLKL